MNLNCPSIPCTAVFPVARKRWRIGVVRGKTVVILKLETWWVIRRFHINIEGNVYIFCIFSSFWYTLYLYVEWFVKKIRTRAQWISFFLYSLISLCFSVYFPFICSLNELQYLYIFVTRYFIHTLTFLLSLFIIICWLLDKVHIGRGLY